MNRILFLLVLLFPGQINAQKGGGDVLKSAADGNTLLWEVSGNELASPSYLYGTFHLLCREDIKFSPALEQAVANCREVYLELDMDDPATLLGALMLINMKDGKKIKDLYSEKEYKRVADFFNDSLQTSLNMFQRMKPEFLVALLFPKMMTCENTGSMEEAVMQLAKDQDKEIRGLETMAFQASLFDSIPYEKQAKELLDMVDSFEQYRSEFNLMMQAYLGQQLVVLEKQMADPKYGIAEFRNEILDKRNYNWVSQLKTIMHLNSVFIAVGAGHLVGKTGLIELLRAAGYTVRGIGNQ